MMKKSEIKANLNAALAVLKDGGYIKGMGTGKYRLMDHAHNPVKNLEKIIVDTMTLDELIEIKELVRVLK